MPITSNISVEAEAADQMVAAMAADSELDQDEIHIERPVDWERDLKDLTEGHIYLDVFPIGITQRPKNRRGDEYIYETHLVVRGRPDSSSSMKITTGWVDTLQWYRDHAQGVFGVKGSHTLTLATNGLRVHRDDSEPFVLQSATALYGKGVFVAPIRITWKAIRR